MSKSMQQDAKDSDYELQFSNRGSDVPFGRNVKRIDINTMAPILKAPVQTQVPFLIPLSVGVNATVIVGSDILTQPSTISGYLGRFRSITIHECKLHASVSASVSQQASVSVVHGMLPNTTLGGQPNTAIQLITTAPQSGQTHLCNAGFTTTPEWCKDLYFNVNGITNQLVDNGNMSGFATPFFRFFITVFPEITDPLPTNELGVFLWMSGFVELDGVY